MVPLELKFAPHTRVASGSPICWWVEYTRNADRNKWPKRPVFQGRSKTVHAGVVTVSLPIHLSRGGHRRQLQPWQRGGAGAGRDVSSQRDPGIDVAPLHSSERRRTCRAVVVRNISCKRNLILWRSEAAVRRLIRGRRRYEDSGDIGRSHVAAAPAPSHKQRGGQGQNTETFRNPVRANHDGVCPDKFVRLLRFISHLVVVAPIAAVEWYVELCYKQVA